MDTAKVTHIEDTGQMWKEFHKVKVTLDNGKSGVVNAKSFPPPYGVGDTVEIKATWPDGNLKSIAKVSEGFEGGGATPTPQNTQNAPHGHSRSTTGRSVDRSEDIINGMCFNGAIRILCSTEWAESFDVSKVEDQVSYAAKSLRAAYDKAFNKE